MAEKVSSKMATKTPYIHSIVPEGVSVVGLEFFTFSILDAFLLRCPLPFLFRQFELEPLKLSTRDHEGWQLPLVTEPGHGSSNPVID
jgi:hypothetical protein